MNTFLQIICATIGTYGFCLLFNIEKNHILIPTIGGGLCWIVYLVMQSLGLHVFWSTFIASAFVGIYGETCARLFKLPTSICFMPSCVPLIPGGRLYYSIMSILSKEWVSFKMNACLLILYAIGIALGLAVILELDHIRIGVIEEIKVNNN